MGFPRHTAACILALLLLPAAARADAPELILGHSGQLQRVVAGPYGELFPEGDAASADAPVLALETVTAGGEVTRELVAGTGDARLETGARLFQDANPDAFVLLWRSQDGDADVRLDFAAFDGAEWSEVLTLERDDVPVSLAGELRIAETHDAFEIELDDGTAIRADRLIVHLLWQDGEASPHTHYAPLSFVEGRYVGWHAVFTLDDLFLQSPDGDDGDGGDGDDGDGDDGDGGDDGDAEEPEPVALTAELARALDLRVGGDDKSVQITFANASSDRLGNLEVRPLPLEIGLFGDQVRDHILSLADLYDPEDMSSFSDGIRAGMVIIGHTFNLHDAHAGYVADQVADWIQDAGGDYGWAGFEALGADARVMTIDVTQEVYVSASADPANPDEEILRLDVSGMFDDEQSDSMMVFDFRSRSNLPAPAIGEGPVTVFASRDGRRLLIAWEAADDEAAAQVRWIESRRSSADGPWSDVLSLPLGEHLTLEAAYRLLARRIR